MRYMLHHYADDHPYVISEKKIISFAQDYGYEGNNLEEAIEFLHDIGNVLIITIEEEDENEF